jgi:signal recognition particle receptor subunit beta
MALFNHATKELTAKIVYYGPGLCGKTTNLKILHQRLERGAGKLLSLSTAQDRTIYFDLLPIELGNIKGYTVRFQVCTVPGQVFYNETRRIVLRGVDGLVFVVDSQWSMLSHNLESFQNLRENLADEKIPLEALPVVIQYNKRDLPSALSVEALQESLGFQSYPYVEAVASEGMGVLETFKLASKLTFVDLLRRLQRGWQPPMETEVPGAETSLGSASPGGATVPAVPGPAISISAPAPEPEDAHASAPVLAVAGESTEEAEWIPPSAEGTFADLSDDSLQKPPAGPRPVEASAALVSPPAPPPVLSPAPGLGSTAEPSRSPRASRPEMTAPVTPLDDKLNAVLAEARRAATGRSGPFKRLEDASTQELKPDLRRLENLEKALESVREEHRQTLEGEREERGRIAKALEGEREERGRITAALEAEKTARAEAERKAESALEALRAASTALEARVDAALAEIRTRLAESGTSAETTAAALRSEAEEMRRGLADAVAAERASREGAESTARDAASALSTQVGSLADRLSSVAEQLAASKGEAEATKAAGEAAVERARRLEEALRAALRDLS